MDDTSTPTGESRALAHPPSGDLARLQERLSFYESFDSLIQENISRAGSLLREAVVMREDAKYELSQAESRARSLRAKDRAEFRATFSAILDDVSSLQGQLERLARRVADALDDLEVDLPGGEALAAATGSGRPASLGAGAPEPGARSGNAEEAATGEIPSSGQRRDTSPSPAVTAEDMQADEHRHTGAEPEQAEAAAAAVQMEQDQEIALDIEETAHSAGLIQAVATGTQVGEPLPPLVADLPGAVDQIADDVGTGRDDAAAGDLTGNEMDDTWREREALAAETQPSLESVGASMEGTWAPGEGPIAEEPQPFGGAHDLPPAVAVDQATYATPPPHATGASTASTAEAQQFPADDLVYGAPSDARAEPKTHSTTVLAHGVPRATTALSLKRYLEALPFVVGVEPREYAEGVLRLQVSGIRAVTIDDVRAWPDTPPMEVIDSRLDWIEFRLSSSLAGG